MLLLLLFLETFRFGCKLWCDFFAFELVILTTRSPAILVVKRRAATRFYRQRLCELLGCSKNIVLVVEAKLVVANYKGLYCLGVKTFTLSSFKLVCRICPTFLSLLYFLQCLIRISYEVFQSTFESKCKERLDKLYEQTVKEISLVNRQPFHKSNMAAVGGDN